MEFGDTFAVRVSEYFSKHGGVRNSQFPPNVSVFDMQDLNTVCEDGDAMSLQKTQHHVIVRPPLDAQDRIQRPIKDYLKTDNYD